MPKTVRTYRAIDELYDELGGRPSLNDRIALWVVRNVSTMWCAYIFLGIGVGSLVGVFTNNATIALTFGAVSSYVLQLVLLPIIMVGQNLMAKTHERHHHAHIKRLDDVLIGLKVREFDRDSFIVDLKMNRSSHKNGHEAKYWDDIASLCERKFGIKLV